MIQTTGGDAVDVSFAKLSFHLVTSAAYSGTFVSTRILCFFRSQWMRFFWPVLSHPISTYSWTNPPSFFRSSLFATDTSISLLMMICYNLHPSMYISQSTRQSHTRSRISKYARHVPYRQSLVLSSGSLPGNFTTIFPNCVPSRISLSPSYNPSNPWRTCDTLGKIWCFSMNAVASSRSLREPRVEPGYIKRKR